MPIGSTSPIQRLTLSQMERDRWKVLVTRLTSIVKSSSALIAALALSCNSPILPGEEPTIEGAIHARSLVPSSAPGRSTVHVKESATDPCGIIFSSDDQTGLGARDASGVVRTIPLEQFEVGARVRAWARGAIAESCPMQAAALALELLP